MIKKAAKLNINLFRYSVTEKRVSIGVYCLGVAAYAVLILAIWPSLRDNLSLLDQLWQSYPDSIRKAFGGENMQFATFDGFLSVEYFNQMWVIVMTAFSVSIASGSVAAEIEKGTMELLLAQPISRRSVLVTHHLFFELGILILIAATIIPVILGAPLVGGDLIYKGMAAFILPAFAFFTAIGSLTFMFSAFFSTRGRAIFMSLGIIIFCYALDILAKINDTISHIHFLSIFYYWDPYRYLHGPDWAWGDIVVLAVISLVSTATAIIWFERRDIAV